MSVIESRVFIERAPAVVCDFVSDLTNELNWNDAVEHMEKVTPGPIGVGTKFRAKYKRTKFLDVTCTSYDGPRSWSFHTAGPIEVDLQITLSPQDKGTLLVSRFDARPKGSFWIVFPLFLMTVRKQQAKGAQALKRAMER